MTFGVSPKVTHKVTQKVTFWPEKSLFSYFLSYFEVFGVRGVLGGHQDHNTTTTERESFGELFWPQKIAFQAGGRYKNPIKTTKTHFYHRNLSSVAPISSRQRKVPRWSRAVYALFFPTTKHSRFWGESWGKFGKKLRKLHFEFRASFGNF